MDLMGEENSHHVFLISDMTDIYFSKLWKVIMWVVSALLYSFLFVLTIFFFALLFQNPNGIFKYKKANHGTL